MKLLNMQEVANVLRVGRARAYDLARAGILPTVRLGRSLRVSEEALFQWIEAGGVALTIPRGTSLQTFAKGVLRIMEDDKDWGPDTMDAIDDLARSLNLSAQADDGTFAIAEDQ